MAGIQHLLKRSIPVVEIDGFEPSAGFKSAAPLSRNPRQRPFAGASARPGQQRARGNGGFRSDRRSSSDSRPAGSWRSGNDKPRWRKSSSRTTVVTGYE
jgi:hypothetical protein